MKSRGFHNLRSVISAVPTVDFRSDQQREPTLVIGFVQDIWRDSFLGEFSDLLNNTRDLTFKVSPLQLVNDVESCLGLV